MSRELDSVARIALADAVRYTYWSQHPEVSYVEGGFEFKSDDNVLRIGRLLERLDDECQKAFALYQPVTKRGIDRVMTKIDKIKAKTNLAKQRSIISLIEFALAVMDEPARSCRGSRKVAALGIVDVLSELRREIGGDREYMLSSIFAANCANVWDSIEI